LLSRSAPHQMNLAVPAAPNGVNDLLDAQILLPLHSIFCVVTGAGTVQSQKTRQPVNAQFAAKDLQSVPLELLVTQRLKAVHGKFSLLQNSGFRTTTTGLPSRRSALRINVSSVVRRAFTPASSAHARCKAS
jgi:hypothetical protein